MSCNRERNIVYQGWIPCLLFSQLPIMSIIKIYLCCFAVEVLLYSPKRPALDFSAIFIWLMAVGTIVCASLWPEFIACEQVDERYNQLTPKVFHDC